ncbi:hypothetical protein VM1G_06966 [Cytospora mali]|uniref:Uncharacterized protein n=1 Tax=Cytospora mali TaxID=578113 RepID=A0A194W5J8_CYTMA|nr:hypothetical protein VM1G_06966 [Valsa mali]
MNSNARSISAILAAALLSRLASAQDICPLEVRTATVTECFPNTGSSVTPSCGAGCPTPMATVSPGGPIVVRVQAPKCDSCGCDACVHTNVYTTTYDVFCPTGVAKQEYVVTETYSGMSGKPTLPSGTGVPFGFTAEVKTCTECGPKPVTATVTYPATGCPYILGMSEPSGAPEGAPAYEVCTTGGSSAGPEGTAPASGPGAGSWKSGSAPGSGSSPGPGSGSSPGSGAAPGAGPESSPGSGSGSESAPAGGAAPAASSKAGYETSPESESGSSPALGSGAGSSGPKSSGTGSSGWNSGSGSSPAGSSGSSSGSGSSPGPESAPGESGKSETPTEHPKSKTDQSTSASPSSPSTGATEETSSGHPAVVAITVGGILGYFISFLVFTL